MASIWHDSGDKNVRTRKLPESEEKCLTEKVRTEPDSASASFIWMPS